MKMPNKRKKPFRHSTTFYRKKRKLLQYQHNNSEKNTFECMVSETKSNTVQQAVESIELELGLEESSLSKPYESEDSTDCFMVESNSSDLGSDYELQDEPQSSTRLRDRLKVWVLQSSTPQVHVNSLLEILRTEGIKGLPKDCRTLIATPKIIAIQKLGSGDFWYNGIENILRMIQFSENVDCLKLNFHIDGLPTGKSTKSQFWPILMNIANVPELSNECFPVAIYWGNSKPDNAQLFLGQFGEELGQLLKTGIVNFQDKPISLKVNAFICDTPARAFIKCIVSHNAYHSCSKCTVTGVYDKSGRHISFPQTDCQRRTDTSFRKKEDPPHHQKNKDTHQILPSPLEKLPIDMIKDFVVADSLHLIHLGLTKRCLKGWVNGSYNFKEKFFLPQIKVINNWLVDTNKMIAKDIHRSVRGLDNLPQWKATEYRTFLHYLGPVILKDHLSDQAYKHFMLLICATTILSANFYVNKSNYLEVTEQMLNDYVEIFISLYGQDAISSNVHNLCHVIEDVRRFGCLPQISTYKFENELGKIKNHLRSGNKPLAQVAKRLMERSCLIKEHKTKSEIIFRGPMQKQGHFNTFVINNVFFKTNRKDQWLLTKNNYVVKILSFYGSQETPKILGCSIKNLEPFFIVPFDSRELNIFKATEEYTPEKTFFISDIKCKLLRLEYNDKTYFFPLVHTLDVFNKDLNNCFK